MILTNQQLDTALQKILTDIYKFDSILYSLFNMQYLTGCRVNEVLKFDLWTIIDPYNFQLQPEKKGNIRNFITSALDDTFVEALRTGVYCYDIARYKTAVFYFHRYFQYDKVFHKNRPESTHLFRHNKAKLLHDAGQSDEEIQLYMGEVDIRNAQNYIYSVLIVP